MVVSRPKPRYNRPALLAKPWPHLYISGDAQTHPTHMPSVSVDLKSFEFGTKLVATFVVEHAQHVQRFILLPTVDSVDTSSGLLFYDDRDQLLGLSEYHGTIGPTDVEIDFTNGVSIRAKLKTPMDRQITVQVTAENTLHERKALKKVFKGRAGPFPVFSDGPMVGFESTHVYVDYLVGPSPFFWREFLFHILLAKSAEPRPPLSISTNPANGHGNSRENGILEPLHHEVRY